MTAREDRPTGPAGAEVVANPIPWLFLLASLTLFGAGLFANREAVIDDAYITFRYARNLASGDGLAFNPGGPPVLGFTSPLMVFAMLPAFWFGWSPVALARLLSVAAAAFAVVPLTLAYRRLTARDVFARSWSLPAVLYLGHYATAYHAMLGMETIIYSALVTTCVWLFLSAVEPEPGASDAGGGSRSRARVALFFGAGFLTGLARPEGFAVCGILAAFLAARIRSVRALLPGVLLFAALALVYAAWSWSTFGALAPNAFYLKVAGRNGMLPGIGEVLSFLFEHSAWLALALLAYFGASPRSGSRWLPLAAVFAFFLLFYLRTLPLMAWEHRYLVPYLALLCWPVAAVVGEAMTRGPAWIGTTRLRAFAGHAVSGAIVVVLLGEHSLWYLKPALLAAAGMPPLPVDSRYDLHDREIELGRRLGELDLGTSLGIAFHDAGAIPFFSNCRFIDTHGLNDTHIARSRDERASIRYVLDAAPDLVILPTKGAGGDPAAIRAHLRRTDGLLGAAVTQLYDAAVGEGYTHAATFTTSYYDLELFVRPDSPHRALLEQALRRIAQGW